MIDIPNEALLFDLFYGGKGAGEETEEELAGRMKAPVPPVTEETPAFRDIHISNITCKGAGRAMFFNGLPETGKEPEGEREDLQQRGCQSFGHRPVSGAAMASCSLRKSGAERNNPQK